MKKALVVGINNYPSAPLRGCIRDAMDIARLLETNGDYSANFDVLLKTDVPRKSTLRGLITELFAGENDIALFYFSGHGLVNELGGYLVTPDQRQHDEGISMNDLLTLANKSKTKNKVIILDCCYSGAIAAATLSHDTTGHINDGITVLTASKHDEIAIEVNGKGVFTNLLIEALKGGAADLRGNITSGSVYAYIDQALGPWDQRPIFKTNISQFASLRTIMPKVPLTTLKKISDYFPMPGVSMQLDPSYEYTNDPTIQHQYTAPFAEENHVATFKALQQMESVGLIEPVGEPHMYWAAMNSKSCQLTPLGEHYWRLVTEKKI